MDLVDLDLTEASADDAARLTALLEFDRFRSRWGIRQERPNHAATAFWRRAIAAYGPYEELLLNDERWHGPVQRLDSRPR